MPSDSESLQFRIWSELQVLEEQACRLNGFASSLQSRGQQFALDKYLLARRHVERSALALREAMVVGLAGLAVGGQTEAEVAFASLMIYYDEREKRSLGRNARQEPIEALQTKFCGIHDGGDRFFDLLEDALRNPATDPLVLQLFMFCLRSGFCGRFDIGDTRRAGYEQELRRRLSRPLSERPRSEPPSVQRVAPRRFPYRTLLASAAAVVALSGSLSWQAGNIEEQALLQCKIR